MSAKLHKLYHAKKHNMKKAPIGSYKSLFIKGIAMRKNIYKHFFTSNIGLKNGEVNIFYCCRYTENCTGILLTGN
jgi:hypothetical protein